jgi:hypothetical protein
MKQTVEARFIEALRRLRARTDHLEQIALWKEDLDARLWRADATLKVTGEALYDIRELEAEVQMYTRVSEAIARGPKTQVDEEDKPA